MATATVKAKYAYDYKNGNGLPAHMEPGDVFTLIKKSNNDWWYVRKDGEKPVYLPATYLQEQQDTAPPTTGGIPERRDPLQGSRHGNHENMMNEMVRRLNRNTIVDDELSKSVARPTNLDIIVPAPDSRDRLPSPYSDTSSPLYPPSRESSWNHGDQNQSQPSVTRNNWAVRLPEGSGTTFKGGYDQSSLGQKGQTRQGGSTPHSPTTTAPSQDDVPQGWRIEQTVTGDPVFINESTSEKWYKATPSDGDPYFYSEDRSKTCWELPAVVNSRRRMVSDSDRAGGDDSRLPSQSLRQGGETRPARPFSFHPHLAPSPGANLPSESRFLDRGLPMTEEKSEMKRKHNRVSVYSPIVNEMGIREKEGILTLLHTKDKSRARKTRPGHGVLAGSQLKHYKDSKHYEVMSLVYVCVSKDSSNPDITISLWKANIFWTKAGSKPSKRLQFELQAEQGSYILQGEDEVASNSWFEAIKAAISGQGSLWHSSPSPDDINDIHSPVSHEAHAVKKSNIREKLKSFMIRRPEKDELKRKGILQDENVFGKHIIKLCDKERTLVPNFVSQCIATIDKRGLMCDGIYRVSGNLSMIQKLRFQVDQEKPVDLETSPWKEDIHVITGALKLYFRELPEPLFTFATFDRFIASITKIPSREQKIKAFQELIRGMPPVNRETIRTLFSHLKRVMDNVQHNRMPAKNLATVFGPTLMWPERESMNMTMATVYQNQVMEFVLLEYDHIF
ncbi:rho GTPase-activating protein 15-like [Diadema antillarum]|uniref:rho GTPase-activating protein 15-like n=1 Tax=Diadema antillarum TaxID=105358 RepID=UPI003A880288